MKYDIFISYRRDGGDTLAQLIYDRLTDRGYKVFLDIESLRSGKFNEKLFSVIDECKDVVVVLPPDALERCSNEGDWLFLEITHALKERKNIIPVMMKGFKWPETLPEGLEELQYFNGIQDSKDYFDAVIDKMVSLLQSRPVLFGSVKKKLRKANPRINIRAKMKRRKRMLIGLAMILLAAAAVFYILNMNKTQQLTYASENVDIMIYPGDDMSASEYYDAQELLKQRLDILADGHAYEFTVNDDTIHVVMPLDALPEVPLGDVLKSYVTRALKLSIIGGYSKGSDTQSIRINNAVDVSRDDIINKELKKGTAEEMGLDRVAEISDSYDNIEKADEYEYMEITLSDEVCRKVREVYGKCDVYYLGQDVEEMAEDGYYYYFLFTSDEPNTFYICDSYQEPVIDRLLEFNYDHEPFTSSFYYNYIMPVEWERVSEIQNPGEYQTDIWDLEEPYVTMQFNCSEDEVKDGEMQDYMSNLKVRLDTLDMPYAVGKTVDRDSEYGLTIRTGMEHLGAGLVDILFSSSGLGVQGMYYDVLESYDICDLEYEKQADGTYVFSLILTDDFENSWKMNDYKAAVSGIEASENKDICLIAANRYRLAKADVTEDINGTTITFDNLYYLGLDTITEEDLYLLDLLKELAQTSAMSSGYTFYYMLNSRVDGQDGDQVGVSMIYDEQLESTRETIQSVYPDASVINQYEATSITVKLNLEPDEHFPEKANEAIQTIYRLSGVSSNERDAVSIYIYAGEDKKSGINVYIQSDNNAHCINYHGSYYGENIKTYQDEFAQIVESDPFYTDTITAHEYYDHPWDYNDN